MIKLGQVFEDRNKSRKHWLMKHQRKESDLSQPLELQIAKEIVRLSGK